MMSAQARPKRVSVTQIQGRKGGDKLVCLTAYTASVARHLDHEVDLLLVGDSLAMTVYGYDSTLPISLDVMIAHGAAVVRATEHALVTVDLPFGSYQESPEQAFRAAARVLAEPAPAVPSRVIGQIPAPEPPGRTRAHGTCMAACAAT